VSNFTEAAPLPIPEDPSSINQEELPLQNQYQVTDPNKPAWGVGGALLIWFASLLLVVVMPLVFLIPYASHRGLNTGMPDYVKALAELAISDKTAVLLQVLALVPSHLITLLLVWALVTRFGKQSFWAAIGWGWDWARGLRLLSCIGLGIVLFGVGSVIARVVGSEQHTQLEQIINSSLAARYAISFLAVFTAPLVEELIYRGVLYAPLERLAGAPGAVTIVLALFTIIHVPQYWPNVGVIAAVALLSIVLTLVRAYSGRLLPCIVIHLVFNGIQAMILILEPYAQRFLPTEQTAPTAALLLSFINFRF
jgi:membrane protease YdiL (CAAX protease family)